MAVYNLRRISMQSTPRLLPLMVLAAVVVLSVGLSPASGQTSANDTSRYKVLGWDNKHIAIVNSKGEVEWEYAVEASSMHDIQLLPNGNILFHNGATVREVNRDKQVVWEYVSKPKEGYTGRVT